MTPHTQAAPLLAFTAMADVSVILTNDVLKVKTFKTRCTFYNSNPKYNKCKNGLNCRFSHAEVLPIAKLTVPAMTTTVAVNPWQIVKAPDVALIDFNVDNSVETTKPIPASPHWPELELNAIAEYEDKGFSKLPLPVFEKPSSPALSLEVTALKAEVEYLKARMTEIEFQLFDSDARLSQEIIERKHAQKKLDMIKQALE